MAPTDDLPWNTTRCNRLLRPLSSKLAKLRRELESARPRSSDGDRRASANAFALKASPRKSASCTLQSRRRSGEKKNDPDWMPNAGSTGANRKTYGGRRTKKIAGMSLIEANGGTARPGELAFTPFLSRTGGRLQNSPQLHGSPLKRFSKTKGPLVAKAEQIQELKKQVPAEIGTLIKGLSEAYANLLQATSITDGKRWNGTRSLLSVCLRKLPEYIELEEYFAEVDREEHDNDGEDEKRDISQEIYTHLETQFETAQGQGWRPFKQVVRAHGTALLCDAFADQTIGLETLQLLVSHCLNTAAWDEAERFLWSFIPNLKPLPIPSSLLANLFDEQRSLYLWMVKEFVNRTGRHRFLYEVLEYMLSQELLPLEWLASTCLQPVWDRLVRILSDGDPRTHQSAFRFLETAICVGLGLPEESLFEDDDVETVARQFKPSSRQEFRNALDNTFSSLFTLLSTIALVNRNRDDQSGLDTAGRITWVLDSIAIGLVKREDMRIDLELLGPIAENMQTFAQRAIWTMFASLVVHLEGCRLEAPMLALNARTAATAVTWVASQYSSKHVDMSTILGSLPHFVSSIANGTGKIWKDDGFEQCQRLVQGMLTLSGVRLPHKFWTMKRLALESAMEFAQSTNDSEHMAFARDVERTMRMNGHAVFNRSPEKNDSSSNAGGFRWEEGIGEWVACTPFAKQGVKRVMRKPFRPLELLPTPEPSSQDDASDTQEHPNQSFSSPSRWEQGDNEHDAFPQSSPVKKAHWTPRSSLGKRSHAASPVVLIRSKRMRTSTSESPFIFYPELPAPAEEEQRRRSSRRNKSGNTLSTVRVERSRSSVHNGLRKLERRTYEEPKVVEVEVENSSSDSDVSDRNASRSFSSSTISKSQVRSTPRAKHSLRKRFLKSRTINGDDRKADEPGRSPGVKRRRSGRQVVARREWWKVNGGAAEEEVSADELSF